MGFYTYINLLCSKTNSAELSLRFVTNHQLNSNLRQYVISGLSLSLRFVSYHLPRLSFYRIIKVVMPKIIKFIRTGIARQTSSHIKFLTKSRMRILRSARKDKLFLQNLCGFMFRLEND